ncbi:MAG: dephospho-CoA kinase [Chloroflexota bacterium]
MRVSPDWTPAPTSLIILVEMSLVIGLTGNIATGKTTVARILAELGAVVIDADKVGHEVLEQDSDVKKELVAAFGADILGPEGKIDRARLARKAFADGAKTARLSEITHPRIYSRVKERIAAEKARGTGVVVLEAALLFEAGWTDLADQVWVTVVPPEVSLARTRKPRGVSDKELLDRLNSQMPAQEKARRADVVIDNSCSLEEVRVRVAELWRGLKVG